MMNSRLPDSIDLDRILSFISRLLEQPTPIFWTGRIIEDHQERFIVGGVGDNETVISTTSIIEELEALASWLRTLPSQTE